MLFSFQCAISIVSSMVGLGGLEPPTSRLSGVRSNHLSYKPMKPQSASLDAAYGSHAIFSKTFDFVKRTAKLIVWKPKSP